MRWVVEQVTRLLERGTPALLVKASDWRNPKSYSIATELLWNWKVLRTDFEALTPEEARDTHEWKYNLSHLDENPRISFVWPAPQETDPDPIDFDADFDDEEDEVPMPPRPVQTRSVPPRPVPAVQIRSAIPVTRVNPKPRLWTISI